MTNDAVPVADHDPVLGLRSGPVGYCGRTHGARAVCDTAPGGTSFVVSSNIVCIGTERMALTK